QMGQPLRERVARHQTASLCVVCAAPQAQPLPAARRFWTAHPGAAGRSPAVRPAASCARVVLAAAQPLAATSPHASGSAVGAVGLTRRSILHRRGGSCLLILRTTSSTANELVSANPSD